ncbi:hypothetical protein F2Q70_00005050 [Brassica cretica]|uniref:Uncharacterized protein n=1 Tax=Brassica cretica TaxID=69181 RepID=A0A8S9IRM2_BRACR|nr:hypothetical protein F2Q70_00005050 [Brassica cretica]
MHPPDLEILETNRGLRDSDGSFGGKAQATSSNSTLGISTSHIVVMAGPWIMYDNGAWDFKIDNDRMGRAVDCSTIKGVYGLKDSILAAYGLLGREIEVEMCYWLIDGDSEMVGKGAAPMEIATDTDYKIFKALHRTDKSFNVFVTFRDIVGGEMIFSRQVEAIEAAIGLNSEAAELVEGSKDSRGAVDAVCGVNLASENMHQDSCGEQIVVERGKNKQANVEAACGEIEGDKGGNKGDDIGNEAGYTEMDVNKGKDEDDDFNGCPPKGWGGGRSGLNSYDRSGARGGRGQGSGKPASGRGQRSRATGGSSSSKNRSNMRRYEDVTDDQRDFLCTSRIVDVAYTKKTDISLGVDVVHATPAKDRTQQNHDEDFVYRRLTESTSGTVRCALTFETGTVESVDVVLVTPPQQNKKHNRVIEDDDEFVDPPLTTTTKVCNSTSASDETHSGESVVNVLVSPLKK